MRNIWRTISKGTCCAPRPKAGRKGKEAPGPLFYAGLHRVYQWLLRGNAERIISIMKTMKLGKTGIDISRIGLGTWSIGGGSAWGGDHDLQVVVDTIREAPKAGVNLIDTAPGYNFGNSEKILGKALEGMNREDVIIITKCGVTWDQEMKGDLFNKVNGIQLYKNLNSASVKKEIEESLERLGTDYIDVYMTHWQSIKGSEYYVPIRKTMDVLNELKAQGKIRAIGAANVDIHDIEEYLKWGQLDIVQAKYSILDRDIEKEIIPCCRENGVTIQAYSPLEMGLLSGTLPRDYKPVGAQIPKKWFQPENMQAAMDVMEQWKPLCGKYRCTIANLALGWILAQGDFLNLLSGSTTVEQIKENVKSAELELDPADVAMMRGMVEALG